MDLRNLGLRGWFKVQMGLSARFIRKSFTSTFSSETDTKSCHVFEALCYVSTVVNFCSPFSKGYKLAYDMTIPHGYHFIELEDFAGK